MELTPEQRATRRANKRNRRLVRDMPLFAEALTPGGAMADWLTTPEKELPAVERNIEAGKRFGEELRRRIAEEYVREAQLRAEAIAGRTAEDIAYLDARRAIYPEYGGYGVNFWQRVTRDPDWIERERERLRQIERIGQEWRAKTWN